MSWFTKPKPAPVKVKARSGRVITDRIPEPISEKNKFYLKFPLSCDQAWEFAGHWQMHLDGMSEDEICRKTGLSLYDVRRSLQTFPKYQRISEGEHDDWHLIKGKPRSLALLGWSPEVIIKGHITQRSEYMTVEEVARATGIIKSLSYQYTLYWDEGEETFSCRGWYGGNRKSPDYGKLTVYRERAVPAKLRPEDRKWLGDKEYDQRFRDLVDGKGRERIDGLAEYKRQIQKLRERMR